MNDPHPPGFRARRGLNWGFVGLLYTSFYMCRRHPYADYCGPHFADESQGGLGNPAAS
ncbi:MAG: hypothetical protein M3R59_08315 [Verrucomicrobiota bacterium]|nr:hypothetical protein [Verrucomicrobiota bacterium]